MAKIDDIAGRVATLEKIVYWVGSGLVLWLGWFSIKLMGVAEDVHALKQASKDRGTEIVSAILHPSSPVEQRVALLTATSDVRKATAQKRMPNDSQLRALSSAVLATTEQISGPPEAWETAASLITYKLAAQNNFVPTSTMSCNTISSKEATPFPAGHVMGMKAQNCWFDLNDVSGWEKLPDVEQYRRLFPGTQPQLWLYGVTLVLDPRLPLISFERIYCFSCRIEVSGGVPLTGAARHIEQAFLSGESKNVTIQTG